jgi:hypothetical protein
VAGEKKNRRSSLYSEGRMKRFRLLIGFFIIATITADCYAMDSSPSKAGTSREASIAVDSVDLPTVPSTIKPSGQSVDKTPAMATAESVRKKDSTLPGLEKQTASQPLDLPSLEKRLRDTKAIGVFTKITLKNQVDDLVKQFREYHRGWGKISLADLRQRYDMLLLKLLSLLQDTDSTLANNIVASREAIWSILTDPDKFATI